MDITEAVPRSDLGEGWLTPEETAFLERTIQDQKLLQYLYTRNTVRLRYPPRFQGSYQDFAASTMLEFTRAHQTLRRLMHKSPYMLTNGQRAYTILADEQVPLRDLAIGSQVTLGYRLLLLRPKYDIGKHASLIELVFPVEVKILPVGDTYYIMDEDHIFELVGFERRPLTEHPSHGTPYHIDLLRMVATGNVRIGNDDDSHRVHIMLDQDEKANLVISRANWEPESVATRIMQEAHNTDEIPLKAFAQFKDLGRTSLAPYFSEETLSALFRVQERKRNVITKLLFEVHSHTLKLSHVISAFAFDRPTDLRYSDLETRLMDTVTAISKQLDTYFAESAALSATASTLYLVVSAKHVAKIGDELGTLTLFDNYLVGYTSADSITDRVAYHPGHVILSLQIPAKMPILVLPEHTGISKYHRAIILPRDCVFQLEKITSLLVLNQPRTYRKLYGMQFRRTETPTTREGRAARPALGSQLTTSHLLQVEADLLPSVSRDVMSGFAS